MDHQAWRLHRTADRDSVSTPTGIISTPSSVTLQSGTRLGPYEILSAIGSGGMGEVWKARDTRLGRLVAVKRLIAPHRDRFAREARAIAALNNPDICQVYDVGPDYLVLEY